MAITGVGRSAFYRYFDDLHALMEMLLLGLEEDIFEAGAPWFSSEGDPTTLLRGAIPISGSCIGLRVQ